MNSFIFDKENENYYKLFLLANETIKKILKLDGVVGAIYYKALVLEIKLSLCAQFAAKVLGGVGRWTPQGFSNFRHVHNNSLYPISFTLNLIIK